MLHASCEELCVASMGQRWARLARDAVPLFAGDGTLSDRDEHFEECRLVNRLCKGSTVSVSVQKLLSHVILPTWTLDVCTEALPWTLVERLCDSKLDSVLDQRDREWLGDASQRHFRCWSLDRSL